MELTRRHMIGGTVAASALALPAGRALAALPEPVVSKIAMTENRVWIAAMIEKSGPHLLIVDTGAPGSVINDALAKKLKLPVQNSAMMGGIGGVSHVNVYRADSVTLGGGIEIPGMIFRGTEAELGRDAAGAIGSALFTSYDSDLDFEAGEWRAYQKGRPNRDGFRKLKSRFDTTRNGGSYIYANATVGGFEGEFLCDTGAPGEITLDGEAAKKSGFWNDSRPYAPVQGRGFGPKAVPGRLIRVDRMKMGPFVFERPLVKLYKPGVAGGSGLGGAGIIGLAALGRFHLSTDVSSGSLWVAPNRIALPPSRYNMSGLWIVENKGRVEVSDVGYGSPAAAAGMAAGDVFPGKTLNTVLRQISGPVGGSVAIDYERGGQKKRAEFVLADYL